MELLLFILWLIVTIVFLLMLSQGALYLRPWVYFVISANIVGWVYWFTQKESVAGVIVIVVAHVFAVLIGLAQED